MHSKKIINFLYYFIFVSIGFFFSPYLIAKGIDPITIGYLTSVGLGLIILFYFILGIISDKIMSSKKVIIINLFLTIIIFSILILSNNFILLCIAYVFSYITFMVLASILDSFILNDIPSKYYNKVRAWGSLGAATSYFVNTFFLNTNYKNLIIWNIAILIVMIGILLTYKDNYQKTKSVSIQKSITHLFANKKLLFVCIIAFLTYGTLKADDPYQYIYYTEYATLLPITVSIVGSLSMFFESFVMRMYSLINKNRKSSLLLGSTFILFIIYFTKFIYYDIKVVIALGYIFIGFFIGTFVPIAISIINNESSEDFKATSLGLYQMSISLGGVIIGFVTTSFLKFNGFLPNIYLLHSVIILIAISLIFIFKSKLDI